MSTVDKKIADDIVAGKYPTDHAARIVKYINAWGGEAYGVTFRGQNHSKYLSPSMYIRKPEIYWENTREF